MAVASEASVLVSTEGLPEKDWLEYRRRGLGGSDAAAILGISPFATARDLYYDKLKIVPFDDSESNWVAKKMGHLLEDLVAEIFHVKTGYQIYQIKKMFYHPVHTFMLADIDYFVELPKGRTAILEIKTTNYNAKDHWWSEDGQEIVPLNYEAQGRHYMAVMNIDEVFYCCLYGNNEDEVIIRHIDRDHDYEEELIALEQDFWENHILIGTPPPYTEDGDLILDSVRRHFGPADPSAPELILEGNMVSLLPRYGIGGDDRAVVYMLLLLIHKLQCHLLFCEDEELGGVGARKFVKSKLRPRVNYIVELDRRGTGDAVFYHCDNPDFTEFVCSFGFDEKPRSFSDISVIAPYLKTAAVNISAGYFNEHRQHELIDTHAMCENVLKLMAMLRHDTCHFPYKERVHPQGAMFGAQSSLFAPVMEKATQKCACKLLMPLPEGTRLFMGQHQLSYAPKCRMDRSGNLYMYLECLEAAVETEGVFACDEEGQPPAFSTVCDGTRFLQVYTYEETVEKLEQAEDAG